MDILAPIIEAYTGLHANYVEDVPPISFLELAIEYEEHIKQWLLKVEQFSNPEVVHTWLLCLEHQVQKIHKACEAIQRSTLWKNIKEEHKIETWARCDLEEAH